MKGCIVWHLVLESLICWQVTIGSGNDMAPHKRQQAIISTNIHLGLWHPTASQRHNELTYFAVP